MNRSFATCFVLMATMMLVLAGVGKVALAEVRVDIRRGYVEPLPVAVTEFSGITSAEADMGRNMSKVISGDLERSGLFRPLDPRAFIQQAARCRSGPDSPTGV